MKRMKLYLALAVLLGMTIGLTACEVDIDDHAGHLIEFIR